MASVMRLARTVGMSASFLASLFIGSWRAAEMKPVSATLKGTLWVVDEQSQALIVFGYPTADSKILTVICHVRPTSVVANVSGRKLTLNDLASLVRSRHEIAVEMKYDTPDGNPVRKDQEQVDVKLLVVEERSE